MPVSSQDTVKWSSTGTRSISSSYASWTLTSTAAKPSDFSLSGIWIKVTTISGAATLTFKLTRDSTGNEAITPETTVTLVLGQGSAASGTCLATAEQVILPFSLSSVYLWVKSDAGTATGTEAHVTGKR